MKRLQTTFLQHTHTHTISALSSSRSDCCCSSVFLCSFVHQTVYSSTIPLPSTSASTNCDCIPCTLLCPLNSSFERVLSWKRERAKSMLKRKRKCILSPVVAQLRTCVCVDVLITIIIAVVVRWQWPYFTALHSLLFLSFRSFVCPVGESCPAWHSFSRDCCLLP